MISARRTHNRRRWPLGIAVVILAAVGGVLVVIRRPQSPTVVSAPVVERRPPGVILPVAGPPDAGLPPAEGLVRFHFDFESGEAPRELRAGEVMATPPNSPSSYCAMGSPKVSLATSGLLFFTETTALRFDYWLGADSRRLLVQVFDEANQESYERVLPRPAREGWTRVELLLSELQPKAGQPAMTPGDRITLVSIVGGKVRGTPLCVDNLHAVEVR